MSGYRYGEDAPVEECGVCGGDAYAEFCDIGVGMTQISPFHCGECGATLSPLLRDGTYADGWVPAPKASDRGERVTGYYITQDGKILEMTFQEGHYEFNKRTGKTTSQRLSEGWVRITNMEGFAIDLPGFMNSKTKRAFANVVKEIFEHYGWGDPYVLKYGDQRGHDMTRMELMKLVSRLPNERPITRNGLKPAFF